MTFLIAQYRKLDVVQLLRNNNITTTLEWFALLRNEQIQVREKITDYHCLLVYITATGLRIILYRNLYQYPYIAKTELSVSSSTSSSPSDSPAVKIVFCVCQFLILIKVEKTHHNNHMTQPRLPLRYISTQYKFFISLC